MLVPFHLPGAFCVEYVVYVAEGNLGLSNFVYGHRLGLVHFIVLFPYRQVSFDPFLIFGVFAVTYTPTGL